MLLRLSGHLVNVFLFSLSICSVPVLQLLLQLLNLFDQTLSILPFHLSIFVQLLSRDVELGLQLLTTLVSFPDHALVLGQVCLQIIQDGLFLFKADQDA